MWGLPLPAREPPRHAMVPPANEEIAPARYYPRMSSGGDSDARSGEHRIARRAHDLSGRNVQCRRTTTQVSA
jgi:hypothetical protein